MSEPIESNAPEPREIPREYENEVERIQGEAYLTGHRSGKRDGLDQSATLVEQLASASFLAGKDRDADMLRALAKKLREAAKS